MSEENDFDGIKENHNKPPLGWMLVFISLIVWMIFYVPMYTKALGGESWNDNHEKEMKELEAVKAEKTDTSSDASTTSTQDIASGEKIYKSTCMSCHMVDLKSGLANLLVPKLKYGNKTEDIIKTITNGTNKGMPPQGNILSKKQIEQVTAYIISKRDKK